MIEKVTKICVSLHSL